MPKTIPFFRDTLSVDQGLPGLLQPNGGDTLVLGARLVTLSGLAPGFNYVIVADQLTVSAGAALTMRGGPTISVFAREVLGAPLAITSAGAEGPDGANGEPGESGIVLPDGEGGRPEVGPGGDGGDGEDGGDGGSGGQITIRYHAAPLPPTGNAPGGPGGRGGAGGAGGSGRPRGKRGRSGRPGKTGDAGVVDILEVEENEVWAQLDEAAREWAAYRAEVAGYFFRKFDPESQLRAFEEAANALLLNPADPHALAVRDRIANRQTPSGLSRDLDIAPDFRALSANLIAEIAVVQNAFQAYVSVANLETIAESIRDNLTLLEGQLQNRIVEAQADVSLAQQDVRIAKAEISNIDLQIKEIDDQIDAIRDERFSIGGILKDVGAIAGVVAGMATGFGAIVSVAGGLATLQACD